MSKILNETGLEYFWGKVKAAIAAHSGNKNNPHGVTAEQVGLGDVDNTPDSEKYVAFASTAGSANKTKAKLVIRFNGAVTQRAWICSRSTAPQASPSTLQLLSCNKQSIAPCKIRTVLFAVIAQSGRAAVL